mmetsp:Transcript_29139/g.36145  ORF Transcript_29139/g.36145 Transcript_29139/m.36145 type:complete len:127 (+) Transcript_29139:181-561(+)
MVVEERESERSKDVDYNGEFDIIKMGVPIQDFPDGPPRPGKWTYPFSIVIPDFLPTTIESIMRSKKMEMDVEYRVHAQFTPKIRKNMMYPSKACNGVSSFSVHTLIVIFKPGRPKLPKQIGYEIRS